MQDEAGKTPETPRWTEWRQNSRSIYRMNDDWKHPWPQTMSAGIANEYEAKATHLEGALREAEKQRDVAIAQAEEWFGKAEEGYRVVNGMQAKLREAEAWKEAVEDAAVVHWTLAGETDPRKVVADLIAMVQRMDFDPAISEVAAKAALLDDYIKAGGFPPTCDIYDAYDALQQPKAGSS